MKAMIFAAGLGTRLKPLTDTMPKAMVPVEGKPILWHAIQKLKTDGFDEIVINVHHFAGQIIDYVQANNKFDIRIEISDERGRLLDTGGGIKKAHWFFDDGKPFLIHNVDIFSNIDLRNLYEQHLKNKALVTLVVNHRQTSRYLLFDENGNMKGWINEKTGEIKSPVPNLNLGEYCKMAFNGIHILEPSVFGYMAEWPERFSIIDFYLSICNKENIIGFEPENLSIIDAGKPEALSKVSDFISDNPVHP